MLKIGCHLSAAKGFEAMANDAVKIGATTFQFFTRNPRGGNAKKIDLEDVQKYHIIANQYQINNVVAHASYTMNGCSADPEIRNFATRTMADDLLRMEHLPNQYYNFHPGSHVKQGIDVGIAYIIEMLNKVIKQEQTTTVLLETMSGKGSEVGGTFEELKKILDGVQLSDKMGVCLDTCHVWDAGYDIVKDLDGVLQHFDDVIGLNRLKAIHLNDSKNILGSKKDRHAKIGEGEIGLEAIMQIINHKFLRNLPFVLETPNELSGYQEEIKLLKSLY